MIEKILTIAVPAYNAEQYLSKCLSSFICEDMNFLEIIVINDGSNDHTLQIAKRFEKRYPETFFIINQENKGHGSGINAASAMAHGKYFRVVDSDDWILTKNLRSYLIALYNSNSDVVLTHFHTVNAISGERILYKNTGLAYGIDHCPEKIIPIINKAAHWFSLHSITYRTDFYRSLSLRLTEKVFYEDTEFAVIPFINCNSIRLEDLSVYEYLIGNTSQSVSIASYNNHYRDLEKVILRILSQYQNCKGVRKVSDMFIQERLSMLLTTYEKIMFIYLSDKSVGKKRVGKIRKRIGTVNSYILFRTFLSHIILELCHYAKIHPETLESLYNYWIRNRKYR